MYVAIISYREGIENFVCMSKNDGNHVHQAIKYLTGSNNPKYKKSLMGKNLYFPTDHREDWSVRIEETVVIDTTK